MDQSSGPIHYTLALESRAHNAPFFAEVFHTLVEQYKAFPKNQFTELKSTLICTSACCFLSHNLSTYQGDVLENGKYRILETPGPSFASERYMCNRNVQYWLASL